jgi:hypothetical protein
MLFIVVIATIVKNKDIICSCCKKKDKVVVQEIPTDEDQIEEGLQKNPKLKKSVQKAINASRLKRRPDEQTRTPAAPCTQIDRLQVPSRPIERFRNGAIRGMNIRKAVNEIEGGKK